MKCNLNLLPIKFDDDIVIDKSYFEKSSVKDIKNLHIKGIINYNLSDEVEINLNVRGIMLLEDANTLEPVEYPINIDINDNLDEIVSESPYFYEKSKNTLDIIEFLWENIVLEVPISVSVSKSVTLKGNGWELINDMEE